MSWKKAISNQQLAKATLLAFGWEPTHTGVPSKRRICLLGWIYAWERLSSLANAGILLFLRLQPWVSDRDGSGLKPKHYYAIASLQR